MHRERTRRVRPEDQATIRVVLGFAAIVTAAVLVVRPVLEEWVFPMIRSGGVEARVLWAALVIGGTVAVVRFGMGQGW
jgi:uncharacterized protein (DUF849 family)